LLVPDIAAIKKEISDIGASGKILAVHAEDEGMRNKDVEKNLDDHLRNRSNSLETSAIKKIIRNAGKDCKLHICHVSTRDSLSLVTGVPNLTSEVAPHHFLLDRSGNLGAFGKVNPPLRKREDRQAMFQALKDGAFDVIASDHAPHTIEEKEEDFDYAPSGVPGVETMVPLVMQHVRDKHLELSGAIRRLCERPAEIFGVPKGRIAVGYDADLMIFDMAKISIIKADALHSKCGWTPYEGMNAVFPKAVFLRGRLMVEDGSQVGERMGRDVLAGQV
jgi:dihydroorotase